MKIEHWQCRTRHRDRELDYRNLLAACPGQLGGGQPARFHHCDTKKGDGDLQWNPADPNHRIETRIRYEPDGSIRSDEEIFDAQLDEVLSLNLPLLKNNRASVLDAVLGWWRDEKSRIRGPVPRARVIRERDKRVAGDGELAEYCQVAVWWLNQKLSRMAA